MSLFPVADWYTSNTLTKHPWYTTKCLVKLTKDLEVCSLKAFRYFTESVLETVPLFSLGFGMPCHTSYLLNSTFPRFTHCCYAMTRFLRRTCLTLRALLLSSQSCGDTPDLYSHVLAVLQPVLYTCYCTDKCQGMSRSKKLEIRVSEYEYAQLQQESEKQGVSMSDLVRKYISKLPKPLIKPS